MLLKKKKQRKLLGHSCLMCLEWELGGLLCKGSMWFLFIYQPLYEKLFYTGTSRQHGKICTIITAASQLIRMRFLFVLSLKCLSPYILLLRPMFYLIISYACMSIHIDVSFYVADQWSQSREWLEQLLQYVHVCVFLFILYFLLATFGNKYFSCP